MGYPPAHRRTPIDLTRAQYDRHLTSLVKEMLSEFRIVYLTGPRQAGKTTLARAISREAGLEYVTLDDQATLASARSDPQGFIRSLGRKRVVLDEFQYAPALIPAIKEASDALAPHERGKFLLTGSADIFRSARTQESLPGHMARLELLPLSVTELSGHTLNLVDYLTADELANVPATALTREDIADLVLRGGYPEVQDKSQRGKQAWFRSYMEGRLYKDFETLHAARGDYFSKLRALAPWLAGIKRQPAEVLEHRQRFGIGRSAEQALRGDAGTHVHRSSRTGLAAQRRQTLGHAHAETAFRRYWISVPPVGHTQRTTALGQPSLRWPAGKPDLHGVLQTCRLVGRGSQPVALQGQAETRSRHRAGTPRFAHRRHRGEGIRQRPAGRLQKA